MPANEFLNPILSLRRAGTQTDPYVPITESLMIKNNRVILSEIPDSFSKVRVSGVGSGWTEITKGIPQQNEYLVSYLDGIVVFHSSKENTSPTFDYKGTGLTLFPYSRLWVSEGDSLDTITTLEDAVGSALTVVINANEFRHRGNYDSATKYYYRNLVDYNNQLFFCMNENVDGILGIAPTDGASTSDWRLLNGLGSHVDRIDNPHLVTKEQISLGNVLNQEQIPKSIFTAKGQIIYADNLTNNNQPLVLDAGVNGQVLKIEEAVPYWGNLVASEIGAISKNYVTALPTASIDNRGDIYIVEGSGLADRYYTCIKDAVGAYAWKEISLI